MKREYNIWLITRILMLLFLYAGGVKLIEHEEFSSELSKSPFIHNMSGFLSWIVPSTEIGLGLMLLIKRTRLLALFGSFFIMSLFTVYVYIMMTYAWYLPCACGGILSTAMGWKGHLFFNIAFTILALLGILIDDTKAEFKWNRYDIHKA